jgi:hypothetical protein
VGGVVVLRAHVHAAQREQPRRRLTRQANP